MLLNVINVHKCVSLNVFPNLEHHFLVANLPLAIQVTEVTGSPAPDAGRFRGSGGKATSGPTSKITWLEVQPLVKRGEVACAQLVGLTVLACAHSWLRQQTKRYRVDRTLHDEGV